MKKRFNGYQKTNYHFSNKIYLKCPRCGKMGKLIRLENSLEIYECLNCGYIKKGNFILSKYELYLKVKTCGKTLWFYNEEHIDYVEKYVEANLRERVKINESWYNKSIGSSLPQWVKDKNNRERILKAIDKVKKLLIDN